MKQFIHKNKYSCCQLISALNALIYFDKRIPNEQGIESLVDVVKCRYGSALRIEDAYKSLDLDYRYGKCSLKWIRKNLPVETSILHKKIGFHSILIVGVKGYKLEVTNFVKRKILWSELKSLFPNHKKHRKFRSFRIKEG